MKRAARAAVLSHFTAEAGVLPFFAPAVKTSDARSPMKIWLRGVDLNHRPLGYENNRLQLNH